MWLLSATNDAQRVVGDIAIICKYLNEKKIMFKMT